MKFIADKISEAGFEPGIWFSPFCVTKDSNLFINHPEWFAKVNGKYLQARKTSPFDNTHKLSLMVLNITIPEVQQYIKSYIRQYKEWGFKLMKLDFLYVLAYIPTSETGMTRAQLFRKGLELIKESAGENVRLMSGISHLSPLVGLIDFVRTGLDTTNPFMYEIPFLSSRVNNYMIELALDSYQNRQFLNQKAWISDSDCIVFNKKAQLSKKNIAKHIDILKNSNSKWLGDKVSILDEFDIKLLQDVF